VARVVVDLQAPRAYRWDAAGNRLMVHLGKNPGEVNRSPFQLAVPTETSLRPGERPVVKAVRAAGPLALAVGARNVESSFTAGADTAVLSLSSGGEVRVCPGTTVSITPSQSRHNLLLGMNTGSMETHLALDASSDSVMTPDFRILLVGPGEFHYAFSADTQGNTCVRALPGNTASAIVTEVLGDRTYQVKATDQLVFRAGRLDRVDMAVPLECGCPPARETTQRVADEAAGGGEHEMASTNPPTGVGPGISSTAAAAPPLDAVPAANSNNLHVQISAPFVFHASGPPPPPMEDARALPLGARGTERTELVAAAPPAASQGTGAASSASGEHQRGFFHKLGRFFSSIFH
jgi:hypothetical protein